MSSSISIGGSLKPQLEGASIVVLGSFNPPIFQPFWFSSLGLIRQEEAESAQVQVVHKEVSAFSTGWFNLQVLGDRFSLETSDPTAYRPLRDLAWSTFHVLEHTPITAFGFNSHHHVTMPSVDEWHGFGHCYVPKASWQEILDEPGMRSLVVEGKRKDCEGPRLQVRLEPSSKGHPAVHIHVNQHYQLRENEGADVSEPLSFFSQTLKDSWDDFLLYAKNVSEHLLSSAAKEGAS